MDGQHTNTSSRIFVLGSSIITPHIKHWNPSLETSTQTNAAVIAIYRMLFVLFFQFKGSNSVIHQFNFTLKSRNVKTL